MSIKVSIKDKNTLVLLENGNIGDEIDLREIQNVDLSSIEKKLKESKDEIYQKMLEDEGRRFELKLANEIEKAKKPLEKEIDNLNKDLEVRNATLEASLKLKEQEVEKKYQEKIINLSSDLEKEKARSLIEKQELDKKHQEELFKLKEELQQIKNQKSSIGSKVIGENLEHYCNNLYLEASQNGFYNCKWYKDNKVIKEEDEQKGSKADYIFEVYASNECKSGELLTNVCLDMKDENPDSTNKKTNESYYKQLDQNRNKKGCKYALLVSNLDYAASNDIPILKVREYPDMYMVRPGYLITFLNMIASLSMKYQDLILKDNEEKELIKNQIELMQEFEEIKKTYLDKPLEQLAKKVDEISSKASNIQKLAGDIEKASNAIIDGYIKDIEEKINKFNVKINRSYKKL